MNVVYFYFPLIIAELFTQVLQFLFIKFSIYSDKLNFN